jgi:ADP-heptose:LPS heptosyltransferase
MKKPKTIFLYLNNSGGLALGDAIIQLPFIRAFKEWSPETQITVCPGNAGIQKLIPLFQPYITEKVDAIPQEETAKFDWVFDLCGESQKVAWRLRRLSKKRFYTTAWRGWLHAPRLPLYHGKHVLNRHLGLFRQATGSNIKNPWPWPIPETYLTAAKDILPDGPVYIGIAPGAGNPTQKKRWPLVNYVELAKKIALQGWVPVVFLGPDEAGWEKAFGDIEGVRFPEAESRTSPGAMPGGPTFVVALATRLQAAVTNCCGNGHLFALASAPLISLFGPTCYLKFAPFTPTGYCMLPSEKNSKKMEDIKLEAVFSAIHALVIRDSRTSLLQKDYIKRISFPDIWMNK